MGNDDAKLFVAGLPDSVSEEVLKQLFEATGGTVLQVSLPKDRATGRPRGFGFVTMSSAAQAQTARDSLDGSL
jgi:nucleolin